MIFDVIAGLFISVLSGMGVGGGGLLVLYLIFVKNMPQAAAQGINLIFFVAAAAASLFYHFKKRKLNMRLLLMLALPGTVGAILGAITANSIDQMTVRSIFGWLSVISGVIILFDRK